MISISLIFGVLLIACIAYYPYRLALNTYYARRTNLPYVTIPFDQNATVWIILAVPLRRTIQKWLPKWLVERMEITIYGWEFHLSSFPFDKWAPGKKTMAFVTCGRFEVNSYDPEFLMDVLKRPKDFHEPYFNTLFIGRFGHNLLTTNGEQWARQRKVLASVINEKISKVVFSETVHQTCGLLDEVLDSGNRSSADTYSAFDMMKKLTIQVLSGAGMGQNVDWLNTQDKIPAGFNTTYMDACKTVMDGVAGPIVLPLWFLDNYPSSFPGSKFIKRLTVAIREYPQHTKAMLDKERERVQQPSNEVRPDIVSQLVQAADGAKQGLTLDESELIGNLFVFTAAGFDTTSNTLSYTLAALVREPKWQTWLFEELDEILPKDGDELDYATIYPKAVRTMAVMYETLRLFTPVVHIPKQTFGQQIVHTSKQDYLLPADTTIYINAAILHHEPSTWRDLNISDAEKAETVGRDELNYRPSRWINKDGTHFQPPKGHYVPWSFGPRNCPGMKMAQVEFTAAILTLLRKHRIDAVPLDIPQSGEGLGSRPETTAEIAERINDKMKDSISILTLQMNGVYDVPKDVVGTQGIKLRFSKR